VPRIVLARDVLALADPDTADAVAAAGDRLAERLGAERTLVDLAGPETLGRWRSAFMARQLPEIWRTHGAWVTAREPSFGPGITARMNDARNAPTDAMHLADEARDEILARLAEILPQGAILAFAAASSPAPPIDLDAAAKGSLRGRTIAMTCIAGLAGLPAVSLPLAEVDGLPVGVCLVGRPGDDELLLATARSADALTRGRASNAVPAATA
jgi:amidase